MANTLCEDCKEKSFCQALGLLRDADKDLNANEELARSGRQKGDDRAVEQWNARQMEIRKFAKRRGCGQV